MKDLMVIAEENALAVFNDPKGLEPCLNLIRQAVAEFKPDLTTATTRKEIASLAHKVAKAKVFLDDTGKDLVADWKGKSKKVDESRRKVREELDKLKILARKPLTDWEAAEAEKARILAEKEAAKKLAEQVETDHEEGLLMNAEADRAAAAEIERVKKEEEAQAEIEQLKKQLEESQALNEKPMMLNKDGTRSIFDDVDEGVDYSGHNPDNPQPEDDIPFVDQGVSVPCETNATINNFSNWWDKQLEQNKNPTLSEAYLAGYIAGGIDTLNNQ